MLIAPGSTSISADVFFADDTGAAVTGKVAADFPACKWSGGDNTSDTAITLSDLAAITTAHPNNNTAGGIKEREGGVYRLDCPNSMFTAAGRKVLTFAETTNKRIIVLGGVFDVQYPQADVRQLLGSPWLAPAVAGVPDVNAKQIGGIAQTGGDLYPAVTNIAVTSAALNKIAGSATVTTGTETNTYTSTATADGVYHSVADVAGTVDYYYQFDLSGTTGAVSVGVNWLGYVVGVVNTIKVYAYNWGNAAWDQIGTIVGIAGTVNMTDEWELTSAHTGTGGNAGLVRIRFNATGLTASSTKTDRILLGYAVVLTPPANWSVQSIDSNGRTDVIKVAGTTQTARDLGLALPAAAPNTNGGLPILSASGTTLGYTVTMVTTTVTATNLTNAPTAGDFTATMKASLATAVGTAQTGDSYPIVNSGSYGNAALLSAIQNIQNNTFIATSIPMTLERPDSGSVTVNISIVFADETGAAKNLDSGNPIITLVNDAGTDLSSRLGAFTNPATGKYVVPYTSSVSDALEGLHWDVSGTINGKLRRLVAYTQIVDTTAVDFTASDRTMLTGVYNVRPANVPAVDGSGRTQIQVGTAAGQINGSGGKVPATVASGDDVDGVTVKVQTDKLKFTSIFGGFAVASDPRLFNGADFASPNGMDANIRVINGNPLDTNSAQFGVNLVTVSGSGVQASGGYLIVQLQDGAITESKITVPAEGTGPPTGILGMILWGMSRLGLRRSVNNKTLGTVKVYKVDGTTVKTTNTYTSSATGDDVGAAT